jgi:hypothetical protein
VNAVRTIALDRDLDIASKLDRSPHFIAEMIATGRREATAFLATLP